MMTNITWCDTFLATSLDQTHTYTLFAFYEIQCSERRGQAGEGIDGTRATARPSATASGAAAQAPTQPAAAAVVARPLYSAEAAPVRPQPRPAAAGTHTEAVPQVAAAVAAAVAPQPAHQPGRRYGFVG